MPVISTNLAANSSVRYLNMNSLTQTSSLAKLASGSRISQASDDAAGLAISTRISSDVTTLTQASTNASHGISVLKTADGGASNISDILQRMKALATQSASGTVTDKERVYIDAEFSQLIDEVDGTATGTRYNGVSLLDTSVDNKFQGTGISVMVGSDSNDTINVTIDTLTADSLGLNSTTAATSPADIVGSQITTNVDASGGDLTFEVNGVEVTLSATGGAAGDGIYSADAIAGAITSALTTDGNNPNLSVTATDGKLTFSNTTDTGASAVIEIANFSTGLTASDLGLTTTATSGVDGSATATKLSVSTQAGAESALTKLDTAIDMVSKARANIGALESRFSFRSDSIATSIENLEAANSAIKDTDVASESSKLASAKVKTQAAVAAAAQASQMPQDLLKLLQ